MKNIVSIILVILVTSCSDSGGDPIDSNTPPTTPVAVSPSNNSICQPEDLEFEWMASSDADGDELVYEIELSEDPDFNSIYKSGKTTSTSKVFSVQKGTHYFWRVKAEDDNGSSSDYSDTFQFISEAEAETNYIPFSPELVAPNEGTELDGTSVSLEWICSDADNDTLSYDIYFGTTQNPEKTDSDWSSTSITYSNLSADMTYYWYVVAKDGSGSSSTSKLWTFTIK